MPAVTRKSQTTVITFKGVTPFLKTKDLSKTIEFYVTLLGFVVDSERVLSTPFEKFVHVFGAYAASS